MADRSPPPPEELARQVSERAESLRAAGVSLLPASTPLTLPVVPAAAAPAAAPAAPAVTHPTIPADLFGEVMVPVVLPVEQRRAELQALRQRVAACARCPHLAATRTQTVFGVGPLDPELCFVGEAPGADEDRQGEPFVGAAGQLLTRIITAMGMKREDVFICNVLRCRPPNNRTPSAEEAHNCREYLERTLELVRPKFICALGSSAAQHLLGTASSIGRLRGRFHKYQDIPVLCTYHPAFLLPSRSPEKKKDVWEDMKLLLTKMGRPIPGK